MMFACQHKIFGPRGRHQLGPLCRIEEMCRELGPKLLILEVGGVVLGHVVHYLHVPGIIGITTVPLIPEPLIILCHHNEESFGSDVTSLAIPGTL